MKQKFKTVPGRVIIRDKDTQEIEAFTFGAVLEIEWHDDATICSIPQLL